MVNHCVADSLLKANAGKRIGKTALSADKNYLSMRSIFHGTS